MYGEGPTQLFEGWSKNLSRGAISVPPLRLLCTAAWISAVLQACMLPVAAVLGIGTASLAVAAVIYVVFAIQTAVLARRIGSFAAGVVVALPVLAVAFVVMFVASVTSTIARREVAWRGRRVRVGSGATG